MGPGLRTCGVVIGAAGSGGATCGAPILGPDERSLPAAPVIWAIRSKTRSIGRWYSRTLLMFRRW